jgi:hypothetical protein
VNGKLPGFLLARQLCCYGIHDWLLESILRRAAEKPYH